MSIYFYESPRELPKENNQNNDISIFAIAIGNDNGKEKFCKFTAFPGENIRVVSDNKIHEYAELYYNPIISPCHCQSFLKHLLFP